MSRVQGCGSSGREVFANRGTSLREHTHREVHVQVRQGKQHGEAEVGSVRYYL